MTSDDPSARERRNLRIETGRQLRTAGVCIATLCGLCTGFCASPAAISLANGDGETYIAQAVLLVAFVIGVLPFLVGLGLVAYGNRLIRLARAEGQQAIREPAEGR